jgi:hypothetical protein
MPRQNKIDPTLCDRVTEAISRLGSRDQFIVESGIQSKSQLSDISRHEIEPSKKILLALAEKGFSLDWLMLGRGPTYYYPRKMDRTALSQLKKLLSKHIAAISTTIDKTQKELKEVSDIFK